LSRVLAQIDPRKLAGVVFNAAEEPAKKDYYQYQTKAAGK
jgi:hypothetical protein